jgi:hypothetical protein
VVHSIASGIPLSADEFPRSCASAWKIADRFASSVRPLALLPSKKPKFRSLRFFIDQLHFPNPPTVVSIGIDSEFCFVSALRAGKAKASREGWRDQRFVMDE